MDYKQLNGMSLAYMGDAIYEKYIREYLLGLGIMNVNTLHKNATKYTSGLAQADCVHHLMNNNILTEEEISAFKRGRNSHSHSVRKNIDISSYMEATGFEAMIGYLYFAGQIERMEYLINLCIDFKKGE